MTLGFLSSAPSTFASSFVFPEKFLFCTDKNGSIELLSLVPRQRIDDCLKIHVLRTKNFVIWCHQVTKIFLHEVRLRQCVFLQGALVIMVLSCRCRSFVPSGSDCTNTVIAWYDTFPRGSADNSWEELAGASLRAGTVSSTRFSVNSSNHSGRSRNGFLRTSSRCLHFCLVFWFLLVHATGLPSTVLLVLSLLVDAGCNVGTYCFLRYWCRRCRCSWAWRACRQTRDNDWYVVLQAAFCSSATFDEMWFLASDPLVRTSMILAEFSEWDNGRCIIEKLHGHE